MPFVAWGIDPGLRDTGAVRLAMDEGTYTMKMDWYLYSDKQQMLGSLPLVISQDRECYVFIEDYRVRAGFKENKPMLELITELRKEISRVSGVPVSTLNNMGVKKIVTAELMKKLGMWDFPVSTHHQDLRSAARILLFGVIKADSMNRTLSDWFVDTVEPGNKPWRVV